MKNNDALKKHHFWILLGVVPLFTLIGVLLVDSNVGGKIDEQKKKIDDANSKIGSKQNPKPAKLIKEAEELVDRVSKKQGGLHKENWNRQKNLFTWPAGSKLLKDIETGEANLDKVIDQVLERLIEFKLKERGLPAPDRAAEAKRQKAEFDKLAPADKKTAVRKELDTLTAADRKAVMEPAWPKFGEALPTARGEFEEFRNNDAAYLYEFSSLKKDGTGTGTGMADKVAPTQFKNGWRSVLRHVNAWGEGNITNDQVWLLMEDIWVQRSLLDGIRAINAETAVFRRGRLEKDGGVSVDPSFDEEGHKLDRDGKRTTTPEDQKTETLFRNRTWAVNLKLVKEGPNKRLAGTLTNISDRLQLLGVGDMMTLNVWFTHSSTEQPTKFRIGGSYLRGKGSTKKEGGADVPDNSKEVLQLQEHDLPPFINPTEIVRVEQVFDVRTVPVKRIDALVLGKTDSRLGDKVVLAPPGPPFAQEAAPAAAADDGGGGVGGGKPGAGSSAGPPPSGSGGGPPGGPMGPAGSGGATGGTAAGQSRGGGPLPAVIDGNKRRYMPDGVTAQVRRMPVGIVVVVDQVYIQDVLLAFANSPLRFQITQVTWTRFRDRLDGIGSSGGSFGGSGDVNFGGGTNNIQGSGDQDLGGRPKPGASSAGPRPIGGSASGPPGGPMGPAGSFPMGGGPTGPSGPGGPTGGSMIASESQITSGLVELSVYGVVSLYEKFVEPGAAPPAGAATAVTAPTVPDPKGPAVPDPKGPAPKDPAATDPKAPAPKDQPVPDPKAPPKEPMNATPPAPPKMRRRAQK